jgi:hypothetical protein
MNEAVRNKLDKAMKQLEKDGYHFFGFMTNGENVEAFSSAPCSPDDFAYNVVTCLQTEYPDLVFVDEIDTKGMVN